MSDPLILIVEDDRPAAMEIRGALVQIGYRVSDQVYSGTESVAKAAGLKPDLIIADISSRDEPGSINAVHLIQERIDVPVIYLTADSSPEIFRRPSKPILSHIW